MDSATREIARCIAAHENVDAIPRMIMDTYNSAEIFHRVAASRERINDSDPLIAGWYRIFEAWCRRGFHEYLHDAILGPYGVDMTDALLTFFQGPLLLSYRGDYSRVMWLLEHMPRAYQYAEPIIMRLVRICDLMNPAAQPIFARLKTTVREQWFAVMVSEMRHARYVKARDIRECCMSSATGIGEHKLTDAQYICAMDLLSEPGAKGAPSSGKIIIGFGDFPTDNVVMGVIMENLFRKGELNFVRKMIEYLGTNVNRLAPYMAVHGQAICEAIISSSAPIPRIREMLENLFILTDPNGESCRLHAIRLITNGDIARAPDRAMIFITIARDHFELLTSEIESIIYRFINSLLVRTNSEVDEAHDPGLGEAAFAYIQLKRAFSKRAEIKRMIPRGPLRR